jgi:hypothetical protein
MTPGMLRDLMAHKLEAMVNQDPREALSAMEMSNDQAPELWEIAQNNPRHEWGAQIMQTDGAQKLLNLIDWTKENKGRFPLTESQKATLAETSLRSILEMMV